MNRTGFWHLMIALICAVPLGCHRDYDRPPIKEVGPHDSHKQKNLSDLLLGAPVILVGLVIENRPVGMPHPSKFSQFPVMLCRMRVQVENVLKGYVATKRVDIFYFTELSSANGLNRLGGWPGYRFLYFLQRDGGELRTVCDVYKYCEEQIYSGPHPGFKRDPRRSIEDDFLDLQFTRGEGATDCDMFKALELDDRGQRWGVDRLIRQLERMGAHETPTVGREACQYLENLSFLADRSAGCTKGKL